jgi:hypothetical protein
MPSSAGLGLTSRNYSSVLYNNYIYYRLRSQKGVKSPEKAWNSVDHPKYWIGYTWGWHNHWKLTLTYFSVQINILLQVPGYPVLSTWVIRWRFWSTCGASGTDSTLWWTIVLPTTGPTRGSSWSIIRGEFCVFSSDIFAECFIIQKFCLDDK